MHPSLVSQLAHTRLAKCGAYANHNRQRRHCDLSRVISSAKGGGGTAPSEQSCKKPKAEWDKGDAMSNDMYEEGLSKTAANFAALTPLTFIERAASVYPTMPAISHGAVRRDWAQTYPPTRLLPPPLTPQAIPRSPPIPPP